MTVFGALLHNLGTGTVWSAASRRGETVLGRARICAVDCSGMLCVLEHAVVHVFVCHGPKG